MAELHCNVYYKHNDAETHHLIRELVDGENDDDRYQIAEKINPEKGRELLEAFDTALKETYLEDLTSESTHSIEGYWCSHLVQGSSGAYVTGRLVKLLNELCPGTTAQAWGCGDDDPWEFWFKYENGRVIRCDYEPYEDEDSDHKAYNTIYRWWHEGLPAGITEGFLHDVEDEEKELLNENRWSDEDYQDWVNNLRERHNKADKDNLVEQGIESPVSTEDVKEIMSGLGELFGLFMGAAKGSKNPEENAFDAEEVTKENVLAAFDDMNAAEREFDLDGVLKHLSKNLVGETHMAGETADVDMPMSYTLYKLGLSILLKPSAKYKAENEVKSIEINDNNTATLKFRSDVEFIDPDTKKLTRMVSEDEFVWGIENNKLQVIEIYSKELETKALE